ncbi:MAG: alpha/beta fold hydrolase [Bryobacteraceae bacterium]
MSTAALTVRSARRVRLWPAIACVALAAVVAWWIAGGIVLCEAALHADRVNVTPEPALALAKDLNATVRDVPIRAFDSALLRAWLFEPPHAGDATVMLFHGMADSRLSELGYAQLLLRHGYRVLAIDERGNGSSGGAIETFGVLERRDTHSWADWLFANTPTVRLYGLGESMGAGILLQSLATETRFRAVAGECSFQNFREIAYDRVSQHFGTRGEFKRALYFGLIESGMLYARWRYGVNFDDASPETAVAAAKTPVMLIHGLADDNVYPVQSERMAARNPRVVLWEPPNTCHTCALGTVPDEFERRVVGWFESHQ